jgi:excisionase family DNA binding protein
MSIRHTMPIPDPAGSQDPVLTTAAAARQLGVAVSTVQLWMESGALPSWKTPGGHRRIRQSAVQALLSGQAPVAPTLPCEPAPHPGHLPGGESAPHAGRLLFSESEPAFERLATQLTGCPIALVSVLAARHLWCTAQVGLDPADTPRELAFCRHAIMEDRPFVVPDAADDLRFAGNPLVAGAPGVRFYAGVPLRGASGHALGILCVMDSEPRRLRGRELKALEELAAIAAEEVQRRV